MGKTKIRVVCSEERRTNIEKMLAAGGFEVCDDAEFVLTESGAVIATIAARDDEGERILVKVDDIEYFECYGHDIFMITAESDRYKISEKMYELEAELPPVFVRISQSAIVHRKRIKKIIPSLFQRFDLIMDGGAKLTVTRGYYQRFRDALGI